MDELAKELASARGAVVPAWSEARAERLLTGVAQLRSKRRAQRVAVAGIASLAAVGLLYVGSGLRVWPGLPLASEPGKSAHSMAAVQSPARTADGAAPSQTSASLTADRKPAVDRAAQSSDKLAALPIKLADGSRVKSLSLGAAVAVESNEPERIQLRLDAGGARFDVIPNAKRQFTVRAGSVEVLVLGTIFDVERAPGRVRVSVSRGKVRVRTGGEGTSALVKMGESQWFSDVGLGHEERRETDGEPTAAKAQTLATTPALERERERSTVAQLTAAKVASARSARHAAALNPAARERAQIAQNGQAEESSRAAWRSLSQSGDYEGAYRLLQQSTVEDDDTGALLDAADAARLSGHPQAAVTYLRKVLDQHRESPVSPLAAFTLGRVLLERLGQPSEAADAFAMARQLAPNGSLAQDALAREVEAWSKAGRPEDAYRRAREYVDTYPKGRRLRAVQLYGGL
jgi:transmembrane sensor